jgi:mannose-1-phosphate guanylyltransferase
MNKPSFRSHDWAIVLAGGNGSRLSALTRGPDGEPVPKQYCSLEGGRSLLGDALARAERVVRRSRVVSVVAQEHSRYWRREFAGRSRRNVVVQPRNRGTAPGILLPLVAVMERDPMARIVLLPSDHFVEREELLEGALRASFESLDAHEDGIVLIGVTPDAAVPDYGWIVPGPSLGRLHSVEAFVEKPDVDRANELLAQGAVWNTFLIVARASALIGSYARRLPDLLASFLSVRPHRSAVAARKLYRTLGCADFSRDVAQGSERRLRLLVAPACGWTDLGTRERVERCLLNSTAAVCTGAGSSSESGILALSAILSAGWPS